MSITEEIKRQVLSDMGRIGGKKAQAQLTPEERHRRAKARAKIRWDRVRAATQQAGAGR